MATVTVVNFSHPLDDRQTADIAEHAGVDEVIVVRANSQIDLRGGVPAQVAALVDGVALSADEWQTLPIVVVLPGLSISSAILLAELNGRMGHFPTVAQIARSEGPVARYEVVGLVNLQGVRDAARRRR